MVTATCYRIASLVGVLAAVVPTAAVAPAAEPANLFGNAGFEEGRGQWQFDRAGQTEARFSVDDKDAAEGKLSALVSVESVEQWGVQFGQSMQAPAVGATYTLAVLAKAVKGPATVRLEIERGAAPWDRAAASPPVALSSGSWTELHLTFKVEKPFPEGWFAYVSCNRPGAEFRLDAFRLYEGPFVPYHEVAEAQQAAEAVTLFDTVAASPAPLAGRSLAERDGWTSLPEDQTEHAFGGDVVMLNDRLACVLRRGAPGAELYSRGPHGFTARAVLTPVGAQPAASLDGVSILANGPGEAAVEATFRAADGEDLAVDFELAMGQTFVATQPRGRTAALRVGAPCRFVVLPDFFADDIAVDAADIPQAEADLPSENFLLHLLPAGDAIVMTVASQRAGDARIELAGQGPQRLIQSSQMVYGDAPAAASAAGRAPSSGRGRIWVAVIGAPGVWHRRDVAGDESGKVLPLDWTAPYPAQWRVDWRLPGGLTASWEMIAQQADGRFVKHGWFGSPTTLPADRKRWTTVYGSFQYPCWLDRSGRGYLQPLARPERFEGPALVYPLHRVKETPLREFTVVDLVRATLGVGPCEYILDVEGQGTAMKGRATCATRDLLKGIYAAGQQKQKKAEIERALDEVVVFVKHIRGRIDQYVDFGHATLAYLKEQRQQHPEAAGFFAEMEASAAAIDAAVERRKAAIKTPQYVVDLTDQFRKTLIDYEGDDALAECTRITHAIVDVGGNQDELVGECRRAVKILRQRAGLAMAAHPEAAAIAREIRDRSQKILRNAASYEAPRH